MSKAPQRCLLLAGIVLVVFVAAIGLLYWPGANRSGPDRRPLAGTAAASSESRRTPPATQAATQHAATQDVPPYAGVEQIGPPPEALAIARWHGPGRKNVEDARVVWQAWENQYIQFLEEESFVEGLRRACIPSELMHVMGSFDVLNPDNPGIVSTLSKSRRFSKLLAYVRRSQLDGNVGRVVGLLHQNARWYLNARTQVEERILKLMADEPELFRAGEKLSDRQKSRLTDLFQGFGTIKRTVPELPMSLKGTSQGLVTISFLLGQTEDMRAVKPLLEIASRDDATFLRKLNKPGNRPHGGCPTPNVDVIADALDRILVAEAGRAAGSPSTGKIAKEYLQWRKNAKLPQRESVSVYAYDEPVTPYGLISTVRRPRPEARTTQLSLPMMEKRRQWDGLTEEMAKKIDTIIEWAGRLKAAGK